jgi:hypothetical protein
MLEEFIAGSSIPARDHGQYMPADNPPSVPEPTAE